MKRGLSRVEVRLGLVLIGTYQAVEGARQSCHLSPNDQYYISAALVESSSGAAVQQIVVYWVWRGQFVSTLCATWRKVFIFSPWSRLLGKMWGLKRHGGYNQLSAVCSDDWRLSVWSAGSVLYMHTVRNTCVHDCIAQIYRDWPGKLVLLHIIFLSGLFYPCIGCSWSIVSLWNTETDDCDKPHSIHLLVCSWVSLYTSWNTVVQKIWSIVSRFISFSFSDCVPGWRWAVCCAASSGL